MGVQGLRKTLEEILKDTNAIEKKSFDYIRKMYGVKVIGIDVMPYLYLNLNHPIRFQKVMSAMIHRITENGIIPFFIFDVRNHMDSVQLDDSLYKDEIMEMDSSSMTLHYKKNTLQRRSDVRNQYRIEFEMYERMVEMKNEGCSYQEFKDTFQDTFHSVNIKDITLHDLYSMNISTLFQRMEWCEKRSWRLKNEHIQYFCMMCLQYQVPYIFSSGEADPLLANLCKEGVIQAVISEDTDMIPYGTPIVLREFNFYSNEITVFHTTRILRHLGISHMQMIDWCILMGNDYNNRLKGYKPLDSLELIRDHRNIENIFELLFTSKGKYIPPSIAYQDIRGIYLQRLDDRYIRIVQNIFERVTHGKIQIHCDLLQQTERDITDS